MISTDELRKAAICIYIATPRPVARDISDRLEGAAQEIDELREFAIWMTGCYDFSQHPYFCLKRDKLLKEQKPAG